MSGGLFNYMDSSLKNEMFSWSDDNRYRPGVDNTFEDDEISELIWDVMDLIHEFDWYRSSDTDEDSYLEAKIKFKSKWFTRNRKKYIANLIDEKLNNFKVELYKNFCLDEKSFKNIVSEKNKERGSEDYCADFNTYLSKRLKEEGELA